MKRKIDLYKYAANLKVDKYRLATFYGVHHQRGKRIATDNHLLCVIKMDYPKELEGKIVGRGGEIIKGNYPKWRRIVPKTTKANMIELVAYHYRAKIKEALAVAKKSKQTVFVKLKGNDRDAYFEVTEFMRFLDFLEVFPTCKVYYTDYSRALKATDTNGNLCLVMPRNLSDIGDYLLFVE